MMKFSREEIICVVEKTLKLKSGSLGENMRADEVENWDSLGHLSILVALDKLFDGKISNIAEMADADSMPKILDILKRHSLL